ncbi:Gpi13p [Sugiyamaella lignohabitans]|uniref:Gpi13p n=1 Tax=Sugiyamaella lignohabitans TaxID=796027 RepID=A0A167C400_9ASCO|nr:Gpi13p [Sugiyamaella lignohabitans]ANB11190.1 Gpi13p [Sugiyamaella lignohabitans]
MSSESVLPNSVPPTSNGNNISPNVLAREAKRKQQAADRRVQKAEALRKVNGAWIGAFGITIWVIVLQVAGLLLFKNGFLLSRPVFEDHSECSVLPETQDNIVSQPSKGCWTEPSFDKAILIVIDALRFDFTIPSDKASPSHFENKLPFLYNEFINNPQNSLLLKFMADPPTTTLQRLKGLTTGSLPTFIDAGSNFAGTDIAEDNWLAQATNDNKTIAFVGDDTWTALFPNQFGNISFPYDSLNVWDLDSVDNGVIEHIFPIINGNYGHWDIAVGHLLGVDHAGHKYGPNHNGMKDKLEQMNQFLENLVASISDDTLLVVMGDHGMDLKGDHGGESLLELEAALWMYSKKPFFGRKYGSDIYNTSDSGKNFRSVAQIDFVPTFSLLMGLPIPFNNLGAPIVEAFIGPDSKNYQALARAEALTAGQIHRYTEKSTSASSAFSESTIQELWHNVLSADSIGAGLSAAVAYQTAVIDHYREKWIKFHLPDIIRGVLIITASLLSVVIAASNINGSNMLQTAKRVTISALSFSAVGFVYRISQDLVYSVLATTSLGIVLGLVWTSRASHAVSSSSPAPTPTPRSNTQEGQDEQGEEADLGTKKVKETKENSKLSAVPSVWTILAIFLSLVHAVVFTSNSFTVWESSILNYLLATFGFVAFVYARRLDDVIRRTIATWHCVAFIVLTKISSFSVLCREEHGIGCKSTFYQDGSSISSPYALVGLVIVSLALPRIIVSFYKTSESYHGAAPIWLSIGLQTIMTLSGLFWFLDGAETFNWKVAAAIDHELLHTVKILIARIGLGASLVAGNYGWLKGTLCCQLDFEGKRPILKGYYNIYGSFAFLFVLNFFAATLIVNKPMGGIILSVLIYHSMTLMEILHLLQIKESIIGPVVFGLLGSAYFFSTGHQATIPSVQWDVGFIASKTISFPLTHIAIFLNSLGPFIITALIVPIVPLWKVGPFKSGEAAFTRALKSALAFIAYHTVVALSSMIWATYFRRHLMVWKIFAPRFMLAAVTLPAVGVSIALALLAVGYTVRQVSNIF